MRSLSSWMKRQIATCLVVSLVAPIGEVAAHAQQASAQQPQQGSSAAAQAPGNGADTAAADTTQSGPPPDSPGSVREQAVAANQQTDTQQAAPQQQQGSGEPLGTAVAPYEKPTGVTASRPAGAAIAPAKQKRKHTILISLGLLAAAGVAVGTVAGLSSASPSHPH
jgi:FtsZ-interacting cell division protein ZipA